MRPGELFVTLLMIGAPDAVQQVRDVLARSPRVRGSVSAAATLAEGCAQLDTLQPDVILASTDLPDEQGMEVIRHLKAQHAALPVIALTEEGANFDRALAAGAADCVSPADLRLGVLDRTLCCVHQRLRADDADHLQHYALLVNSLVDAVIAVDKDRRIRTWNPAAEQIYGWTAEEAIGRVVQEIVQGRLVGQTNDDAWDELWRNDVWRGEAVHRRKDGTYVQIWASTTIVRDRRGEMIGVVSINRDVTDRKRTEMEVRRLNTELETVLGQRTSQLSAAKEEIESFTHSISHDLRAPLRAIDGFSQALLEDYGPELAPEARHYLGRIRAASQRMGHLIDAMLQLARLTRDEIEYGQVDLSALAREIVAELIESQPGRSAEFIIGDDLAAWGDAHLLRVVLSNLLSNAWKFTGKTGHAVIEFNAIVNTDSSRTFFVRDNGAGFDMAYADKLFHVFQRLHSDQEFEGIGIGLATVQRIIQRHGGRIWAVGTLGSGASFYFTL